MRGLPFLCRLTSLTVLVTGTAVRAERVPAEQERFFESHVRPLLAEKCQGCHGATVAEAGLRLDSRPRLLAGSDTGPVVVPGDAASSRLIAAVRHVGEVHSMPPDDRLTDDEVDVLETWVTDGLPWSGPGGEDAASVSRADEMRQRLATSLASHWAFLPVTAHEPPPSAGFPDAAAATRGAAAIDRFVAARIAAAGFAPSPEAAPRDLVRRLWFDLTGLPPPAAEADAFCADPSEDRYRRLVDRLLASPEHAEHWARKWLDLARYADTMGYAFDGQDPRYPFAWTYRDWVVGALAADVPYDRFVTLQLAADLVAPPAPPADLAALGFLTVGRTFLGNRNDIVDDQIDVVTRGLMGLTVACARCHDHKYEPVTMADYYALHGIFSSSSVPEELPQIGPPPTGPEAEAFAARLRELQRDLEAHLDMIHARATREAVAHAADYFLETARPAVRRADGRPPRLADGYDLEQLMIDRMGRLLRGATPTHPVLGPWAAVREKSDAEVAAGIADLLATWQQPHGDSVAGDPPVNSLVREEMLSARPTTLRDLAAAYGRLAQRVAPEMAGGPAATAADPAAVVALREVLGAEGTPLVVPRGDVLRVAGSLEQTELRKLRRAITQHTIEAPGGPPRAMVVRDVARPADARILLRGNPARPGDVVGRRLPELLGGTPTARDSSGRLDLARGVVAPGNPLTARVLVNWVWTHHFGAGLVPTADDFGLRGEPPVHPELLDDLARRFVAEGGWSLRWLHREIVTSRAWRQSSAVRPELVTADPDNRLFARAARRRLDWEAWRDSLLVAAGTLDLSRRGGPGVDPLAVDAMHARSLYARLDRQHVPGMLRSFDVANPDTAVHVRQRTTVPQQALAALNAPLVVEAARRAAERVTVEVGGAAPPGSFVTGLWRAVLARSPDDDEHAAALVWLAHEEAADAAAAVASDADGQPPRGMPARARLAHALMATAEFQHVD